MRWNCRSASAFVVACTIFLVVTVAPVVLLIVGSTAMFTLPILSQTCICVMVLNGTVWAASCVKVCIPGMPGRLLSVLPCEVRRARKTMMAAATTVQKTPRAQPASKMGQALRLRAGRGRCGGRLLGRPWYSYSSYSSYSLGVTRGVLRGRGGLVLPVSVYGVGLAFPLVSQVQIYKLCGVIQYYERGSVAVFSDVAPVLNGMWGSLPDTFLGGERERSQEGNLTQSYVFGSVRLV